MASRRPGTSGYHWLVHKDRYAKARPNSTWRAGYLPSSLWLKFYANGSKPVDEDDELSIKGSQPSTVEYHLYNPADELLPSIQDAK